MKKRCFTRVVCISTSGISTSGTRNTSLSKSEKWKMSRWWLPSSTREFSSRGPLYQYKDYVPSRVGDSYMDNIKQKLIILLIPWSWTNCTLPPLLNWKVRKKRKFPYIGISRDHCSFMWGCNLFYFNQFYHRQWKLTFILCTVIVR